MNRSDAAMWWGGHAAALASQRSGLGVFAPDEFHLRRFHLGLDDAISALIEARGGYQRSRRMPGDQRLSPSLTPSKTYTNPDRSTSGKHRSSRRALHLGSSDGLNHPEINNKDLDDSRRVSVPGPPRGGRVFNPSKGKGGFNNATSQRRVNEPDAPWATRLRLKLRDPRVMTDEDRINNIEDRSSENDDDVLRGTLEDLRALYTPGNEKPEGFEVSLTSPRSCIVCLKAGCDPTSLVPRPDPGKFILVILVFWLSYCTGN